MPSDQLPFFQSPKPTLRHLVIEKAAIRVNAAAGQRAMPRFQSIERAEHYRSLSAQVQAVDKELDDLQRDRLLHGMPGRVDLILEIDSEPDYPLSAQDTHALSRGSDIALLQARPLLTEDGKEFTRVLLHVPYGQLPALTDKFRRYGEELTALGNVPNAWVANVSRIVRAALQSLWTDPEPMPADDAVHWWQFWIRRNPPPNVDAFEVQAAQAGLALRREKLRLPEHIVMVGSGTLQQLEGSLDLLNTLAEIRAARPWHYELSELSGDDQHEWIAAAIARMILPGEDAPVVCILDSGINRGHPLLAPLLAEADNHTIFPDGVASDAERGSGHGTLMAGLAAYADLRGLMLDAGAWTQRHRLEGVKLLDPNAPHEPQNYGAVTIQAVVTPEVGPQRKRVYVMAVTATGDIHGQPSAWSAAVDNCAFGAEEEGGAKAPDHCLCWQRGCPCSGQGLCI